MCLKCLTPVCLEHFVESAHQKLVMRHCIATTVFSESIERLGMTFIANVNLHHMTFAYHLFTSYLPNFRIGSLFLVPDPCGKVNEVSFLLNSLTV